LDGQQAVVGDEVRLVERHHHVRDAQGFGAPDRFVRGDAYAV
jgi:hypothetical protein